MWPDSSARSGPEAFLDHDWLDAVAGKDFFYPVAGFDIPQFIDLLAPRVNRYICCDLAYTTSADRRRVVPAAYRLVAEDRPDPGVRNQEIVRVVGLARDHRDLSPSVLQQDFSNGVAEVTVLRRRGFGQYALIERSERSIGVFVHRRDSIGEGGSNVWFLANRRKEHEPVSKLWNKLAVRLADIALVISDGSLTTFEHLRPARNLSGAEDYLARSAKGMVVYKGFSWTCVGYMPNHTLIWGLRRLA